MEDILARVWSDLIGRLTGPMTFRLILQPCMATFFAIRDGLKAAQAGRPIFGLFSPTLQRGHLLKEGWKAVMRIFILGIVMDVIYQYIVLRWFYPGKAIITSFILAILPYLLIRGPVNRIAWLRAHKAPISGHNP